jgi:hypothetical protein
MKSLTWSLLFFLLISYSGTLRSQDAAKVLDRVYGLDQTLCNGKKYTYFPPAGAKGHQYLLSQTFSNGSITLNGKCYQDVYLNYDIFNQQLLLQFKSETILRNTIEVSKAWLTGFSLGSMNFEFLDLEKEPRFFQVLGAGPVRILYFWRKNLDVDGSVGSFSLTFTRAVRDSYVFTNGQLKPFTSKRSLIKLFDAAHRPEIKSYLRKNKIKIRKASDQAIAEMITFIGNLK